MKQCPQCRTTYTDDSLLFCLADGTSLVPTQDADATLVSPRIQPARADIVSGTGRAEGHGPSRPSTTKVVVVFGAILLFFLVAAAIAGSLLYFNRDSRKENANTQPDRSPTPAPTATPDLERERLQTQLANMQKQLDEQKAANAATAAPTASQAASDAGFVTARVNSPNDGFLALRDKPHAQLGTRIEKVPHGATVTIENCGPLQRRLGGRLGRWCMITYNGKTGYAFDAFLDRQ